MQALLAASGVSDEAAAKKGLKSVLSSRSLRLTKGGTPSVLFLECSRKNTLF